MCLKSHSKSVLHLRCKAGTISIFIMDFLSHTVKLFRRSASFYFFPGKAVPYRTPDCLKEYAGSFLYTAENNRTHINPEGHYRKLIIQSALTSENSNDLYGEQVNLT